MKIIGLDIGGSKTEGIFWDNGKILRQEKIKTAKSRRRFFAAIFALVGRLEHGQSYQGLGLSLAGAIDNRTSTMIHSPNLSFLDSSKVGKILEKKLKKKVLIENDTNCFLLAHQRFGLARGKKNIVALTLGTGVGGAVLVNGKMLKGAHGAAGELGHMVVAIHNSPSLNLREGRGELLCLSLEDLASSHFFKQFGLGGALDVQHKAEAGNKKAQKIYRELGKHLGIGLASFINIFDPELIILGGGISRGWHLYKNETLAVIKKYTLTSLKYLPPVKISKLKHAGALGAVSLFLKK